MYYDYDNISGYVDLLNEIEHIMKDYPDEYESVGIMYHNHTPNTLKLFKRDTNVIDTKSQVHNLADDHGVYTYHTINE